MGTHPSFARVKGKTSQPGSPAQGHNGGLAQSAVAHSGHIIDAGAVRLVATAPAYPYPQPLWVYLHGEHGVGYPFIPGLLAIALHAKRHRLAYVFSTLVNNGALAAAERLAIQVRFKEILPQFRTDAFGKVAQVTQQGVIAEYRVPALADILPIDQVQGHHQHKCP